MEPLPAKGSGLGPIPPVVQAVIHNAAKITLESLPLAITQDSLVQ